MQPRDRLLLFVALDGAPDGLDPIRLQFGMFLDAESADADAPTYHFQPYNFGPMSRQLYADLDELVADGFVEPVPVEGVSWSRYVPADAGLRRGRELMAADTSAAAARRLYAIKRRLGTTTFTALHDDICGRHAEFADRTIFVVNRPTAYPATL